MLKQSTTYGDKRWLQISNKLSGERKQKKQENS